MSDAEIYIPDPDLVGIRYEVSLLEEHLESVKEQMEAKEEEEPSSYERVAEVAGPGSRRF